MFPVFCYFPIYRRALWRARARSRLASERAAIDRKKEKETRSTIILKCLSTAEDVKTGKTVTFKRLSTSESRKHETHLLLKLFALSERIQLARTGYRIRNQ